MKETILNQNEAAENVANEPVENVGNETVAEVIEEKTNGFEQLGLADDVLAAIKAMGFEEPSQIQAAIIPTLMAGNDAIGQAQTGTGKTLAFGAPMMSILKKSKHKVSGLVLAPTRELAVQVSDELARIAKKTNLRVLPVFGGAPIDRQMRALRDGVDIVVGTPGRVIDLIGRKKLNVADIEFFVLDEADEMLNMGFIEDVEEILSHASSDRQTMLFSATMPQAIKNLAKRFMKPDADHIAVKNVSMTVDKVEQFYFEIKHKDRFESLCRILDATSYTNAIIFCNTKVNVDTLTDHLKSRGYDVDSMHGDINQQQRMRVLAKFKEGAIEILVATDVAARGIDVENISHVINYDLPQDMEAYVHRIGRTGRAGRSGSAFTLVTPREYMEIKRIEKFTKSKIRRKEIPSVEDIFESKYERMLSEISEELAKGEYKKFLPQVLKLDEDHNLAEVAAALMIMRYRDEVSFDYTKNKLDEANANARVFITVGKMDGLNPLKLLKFLQSNVKVDSRDIGDIEILEKFSFFEIRRDLANEVMDACRGKKLLGRKVAMELAEGKDKRKSRPNRSSVDRNQARTSRHKKVY